MIFWVPCLDCYQKQTAHRRLTLPSIDSNMLIVFCTAFQSLYVFYESNLWLQGSVIHILIGDWAFWSLLSDCGTLLSMSSMSVVRKRLKTHPFSQSFTNSPVLPAHWLCHFRHELIFLLTYLLTCLLIYLTHFLTILKRLCSCTTGALEITGFKVVV